MGKSFCFKKRPFLIFSCLIVSLFSLKSATAATPPQKSLTSVKPINKIKEKVTENPGSDLDEFYIDNVLSNDDLHPMSKKKFEPQEDNTLLNSNQVWNAPVLIIIMDFADTDADDLLPNAEIEWSNLLFGTNRGQGNHYLKEAFNGKFFFSKAKETYGVADNGVIRVSLADKKPDNSTVYVIQDQPWIPQSLDIASNFVDFKSYDANGDGVISNRELAVFFVLNIYDGDISGGAGAEANIPINYAINGTGPLIHMFARTTDDYTSIGVNIHELFHHILKLNHFVAPTYHGIMGLGSYGEDPEITQLTNTSHWGTRPTYPIAIDRIVAGFTKPQTIRRTSTVTLNSIDTGEYNIIKVPVVDGFLYIENRPARGYDQSIPFCNGDKGGLFFTEDAQYVRPLNITNIDFYRDTDVYDENRIDLCDYYALKGHNDTFSLGQYSFSKISAPGPKMTLKITKNPIISKIDSYKWTWDIKNPDKEGYQLIHNVRPTEGTPTIIDFSKIPHGDDPNNIFSLTLQSYYNTGEIRSVNAQAHWQSSSNYVEIKKLSVWNGAVFRPDAIIQITLNPDAPYQDNVIITATHKGRTFKAQLISLPKSTGTF